MLGAVGSGVYLFGTKGGSHGAGAHHYRQDRSEHQPMLRYRDSTDEARPPPLARTVTAQSISDTERLGPAGGSCRDGRPETGEQSLRSQICLPIQFEALRAEPGHDPVEFPKALQLLRAQNHHRIVPPVKEGPRAPGPDLTEDAVEWPQTWASSPDRLGAATSASLRTCPMTPRSTPRSAA